MPDEVVETPFGKFLVNPDECIGATVKAGTVWDGPGFLQVIAREHGRLGEVRYDHPRHRRASRRLDGLT